MKVVFLDVDGVLNCADRWDTLPTVGDRAGGRICPQATKRLRRLVTTTDARIVVSSTWRIVFMAELTEWLHRHGIARSRVIGRTPHSGRLGEAHVERGEEIQAWLDEHPEVTAFVILDDDADMAHLRDKLVQTTWAKGLLDEHVDEAISMLIGGGDGGLRSRSQERGRR